MIPVADANEDTCRLRVRCRPRTCRRWSSKEKVEGDIEVHEDEEKRHLMIFQCLYALDNGRFSKSFI